MMEKQVKPVSAKTPATRPPKPSRKKQLKEDLSKRLLRALADFNQPGHEKKLQKLVKKASKLLAEGLRHQHPAATPVKAPAKKTPVKTGSAKKSAVKRKTK